MELMSVAGARLKGPCLFSFIDGLMLRSDVVQSVRESGRSENPKVLIHLGLIP